MWSDERIMLTGWALVAVAMLISGLMAGLWPEGSHKMARRATLYVFLAIAGVGAFMASAGQNSLERFVVPLLIIAMTFILSLFVTIMVASRQARRQPTDITPTEPPLESSQ